MEPIAEGPPRTGTIRRLSPDEERQLFTQLRWLRRRAARRGVTLATDRTSAGFRRPRNSGEVMSEVARELNSLRQELAEAYFKLAVSVARGFANHPHEIDDLVGHASLTLLRAIDLYDVSRGFRFSTYATRALRTELSRYVVRRRKHELSIDPVRIWHRPDRGAGRNSVPPSAYFALEEMLDRLDPRERLVVRSRFGMADSPGAETLQSVAKRLGLSRERVRQLERGALAKLRDLADQPQYAERLQECTLGD
jgi:RNA polymerase primary sigma factor